MPNLEKFSSTSKNLQEPDYYPSTCPIGPLKCLALLLYGVFLKEFIFGWPEQNIQRVFHTLVHVCFNENFWFRLSSLICQRPGSSLSSLPTLVTQNLPASSSKLTNNYFWPASNNLMKILHSYSYTHQARILFILYGPLHRGNLMWRTMCENTAADSQQLSACFGELGSVLSNMLHSGLWTPDDIINIIDQITITPENWLAENVACLLHTSGPEIALLSVTNKARSGKTAEVAVTLTSLCLVQVKIRERLTELINLVSATFQATKEKDRTAFLDQLARSFQDVIVDLYETDELEERVEDFSTILRAQAEFMRALMAHIYEE
ncbi:unnamed protein product [Schistosoma spindalis]|nr:unnamed protein product [Schistosoma spindale]